ncbi:uncharacterized protein LOC121978306 [Zingiber officinale]|uniref:uncharacterized protein LOC121978306 n=1 Tax=Zingiber officinale TaxID=94328 RepID=UPI001C4D0184|nr:uncharacterized protein LOC121978306 [Zingiber officinale]
MTNLQTVDGCVECGYCVMRYMKEIIECEDLQLERKFAGWVKNQYYTQTQYDEVRIEWSEFVYSFLKVLQDVPILVMVSMLAYFCFLEQLLVSELGPHALAVSLPFSCVLGLLASMIASTMVSQSYIWAYASFQFALVIHFAHVFYSVLGVSPVFSILLSSFTGFGILISMNSLLIEYLRWRARRTLRSVQLNQSQQQNEARNLAGVEDGDDTRQQDLENQIQDPNPLQHGQNHS